MLFKLLMKIFAISVIKNESDIIQENLLAAAVWADKVFVLDNNSTDGTWEIVQALSKENNRIVPWKQDGKAFSLNMASEVYYAFKHLASEGDWWCHRLDADEFYIDDPRYFLPTISKWHQVVMSDSLQFSLTYEDVEEYGLQNRANANINKLKYYQGKTWSEARFFRHRKALEWEPKHVIPKFIGVVSPKHIRLRHYQYRSIEQIQIRIETRLRTVAEDPEHWKHATSTEIEQYLDCRANLIKYNDDDQWYTEGSINNYHQNIFKRIAKIILHRLRLLP